MLRTLLVLVWVAVAAVTASWGSDYYLTSLPARAFHSGHDLFAPHALVGHGYGVFGTLMILVGVAGYSVRKRWARLHRLGKLKNWLDVHIFLCTLGPYLVLLHTSFKFGGVVSIAFWSMTVVVASGVFGRYVYAHIPKTVHGQFLSLQVVLDRRNELLESLKDRVTPEVLAWAEGPIPDIAGHPPGLFNGLLLAIRSDLGRGRRERRVASVLRQAGISSDESGELMAVLRDESRTREQLILLTPFQRLFHYWHVLHLPLALVMLMILVVHVGIAVAFGYAWVL